MLVARVLPQVTAQLGSVKTFGVETSSTDVETIECAQKIIDRFVVHMKEIAAAGKPKVAVVEDVGGQAALKVFEDDEEPQDGPC